MRIDVIGCLTTGIFAFAALGQTPATSSLERVFYLSHTETPQQLQEVTNVVRAMSDTPGTFDTAKKTLTLRGNATQLALAEWLVSEMDRTQTMASGGTPTVQPYRDERGQDQVIRVFSLSHATTPLQLMELTNLVRSISDMQRVFPYNALHVLVMRGTADQMGMAEWLVQQLDRPAGSPPTDGGTRDMKWGFKFIETAHVFYLTHGQSPQETQAIVNQLRTETQVQRAYPFNALHALAVRGTTDQMASVDRIIKQLDR